MTEKPPTRLDDARALKRMNIPLNTPVNTRESTRAHHPLRTQTTRHSALAWLLEKVWPSALRSQTRPAG